MINIIILFVTVFVSSLGQISLKKGVTELGVIDYGNLNLLGIFNIISSKYIIIGIGCYGISLVLTLLALSRVELGIFALFTSLSYVIVLVLSYYFFDEIITNYKLIGAAFILVGVFFILI